MFKVLTEGCEPTRGSKYSAFVDLYASEDVVIGAGETVIVPLGVCIDEDALVSVCLSGLSYGYEDRLNDKVDLFMSSHYLALHPRSSLRAKGLIANVGVIDLDYRDEIKMIVHNFKSSEYKGRYYFEEHNIKKGDKIAQIMLVEHKSYLFGIDTDKERTGGFGSTDNA